MLKLFLCNPFLFFPINLHNCCPSELKRSILSYAFQENLVPPALAFGVPVKNGKEQAVLKKKGQWELLSLLYYVYVTPPFK